MKIKTQPIFPSMLILALLAACSQQGNDEKLSQATATDSLPTETVAWIPTEPTGEPLPPTALPISAQTPRLTIESSSGEIIEKMLTGFLNWQSLEVEGKASNSSLNPDDSVAYTLAYQVHTWIDQPTLRFRTEEEQIGTDGEPKLAISDGRIVVNREAETVIEGYPQQPPSTFINPVNPSASAAESIDLLRSGESIFPPMGEVYNGQLNTQIFSSAYAVQYPGVYEPVGLETIAGRETLQVTYDDADRWGRTAVQLTLWVDTETGMVLKTQESSSEYHYHSDMEVTAIVYNPALDESLFTPDEAMPVLNLDGMQKQTIDGVSIYAGTLQRSGDKTAATICYDLPSTADWMLYDTTNNAQQSAGMEMRLFYLEQAGALHTMGLRCDMMVFDEALPAGPIHLEIGKMQAPPREGTYCDEADAVQMELNENGSGIRFTCVEDHGTLIQIEEKPQGMTDEEAQNEISALMSARNTPLIEGPWVFDLVLEE